MITKDVIIIGAGVAGLCLSRMLEEAGISYVTLEKRIAPGTYGPRIISLETVKKLNIPKKNLLLPIKEIDFYSPQEHKLSKVDKNVRGYVANLKDIEIAVYNSLKNKENILLNHNVLDFDLHKKVVKTNKEDFQFKLLIFATGLLGLKFRNKLNIQHPRNIFCYSVELKADDKITTILDNDLAPGFYGWIIPLKNGLIEVGFGSEELNIRDKEDINKKLFSLPYLKKYKSKKHERINAGYIPISTVNKKANGDWIIIGDASGGEPMLGGSIHKCADEAKMAFQVIKEYFNNRVDSLQKYNTLWNEKFKDDIESQEKIRSLLDRSKNKDFDKVFEKLQKEGRIEGSGLINDLFRNIVVNLDEK